MCDLCCPFYSPNPVCIIAAGFYLTPTKCGHICKAASPAAPSVHCRLLQTVLLVCCCCADKCIPVVQWPARGRHAHWLRRCRAAAGCGYQPPAPGQPGGAGLCGCAFRSARGFTSGQKMTSQERQQDAQMPLVLSPGAQQPAVSWAAIYEAPAAAAAAHFAGVADGCQQAGHAPNTRTQ